jgi:hypothetical protein
LTFQVLKLEAGDRTLSLKAIVVAQKISDFSEKSEIWIAGAIAHLP